MIERRDNMSNPTWIALIPAYKPDKNLRKVVEELYENEIKIVIVDDGSGNNYQEIFCSLKEKAIILTHKENKGKGNALKTGLKYIKNRFKEPYFVVTLDCDGQHTLKDAKKLLEYNTAHPDEIILGSRPLQENVPLRSKIGNTITRGIFQLVTSTKVYDTQTGLRSFSNKFIDKMIKIKGERYEYEINVLLTLAKEKLKIKEIEIETIYINNNSSSHFNPIKDSYKIYKEILKFSISSILSFLIDILFFSFFIHIFKSSSQVVIISNILARVISSTFNFYSNKRFVFKKKNNTKKEIISYFSLAIFILLLNTIILSLLTVVLQFPKVPAKVFTEFILFIGNYLIQSKFIFGRSDNNKKE